VSLLPFLAVAFAGGAGSLLLRASRAWSAGIGVVALGGMVVTAGSIVPGSSLVVGGSTLAASEWARLFALLGSVVGLGLVLVGLLTSSDRDVPGVTAIGLGAAVLALALPDPGQAVVSVTIGGLVGVLVTALPGEAARGALVGIREIRAVAIGGALAIVAAAWVARPLETLAREPAVFGFAYLGFVLAVAIRFGAIPFHFWAARLADSAPASGLPLLMAWSPAALAAVALAWVDGSVAPLLLPLENERALVAAIGAVSIVLGIVAAWVQDDLEHVLGYTIIADAGVAILGLAVLDPAAWQPTRTWLIVFLVGRSAFAAWVAAIHGAFGTRRLPELSGWLRRAPVLAASLAVIAVASIGWPAMVAWEARARLEGLALPSLLAAAVGLAPLLAIAIYARIVAVGLAQPGRAVDEGMSERPGWPTPLPRRPVVGRSGTERVFERSSHAIQTGLDVLWVIPAAIRQNRVPITAVLVAALAALSIAVSAGGLGVPSAAGALPATVTEPGPAEPGGSAAPS
jgi:formate hydrogenlyase subunit 3/multisubunit Na+/H+ antiporter MnhD subunit